MATAVTDISNPYIKALIYGLAGSGKTTLASQFNLGDFGPALFIDANGNPETLQGAEKVPSIIRADELSDFNIPYRWIEKGQPKNDPIVKEFKLKPPYKTLVFDHITRLQQMMFARVMNETTLDPVSIGKKREWDHYGKVMRMMERFAAMYYSLDMNVIMIAQEKATGEDKYIRPALDGQALDIVPSYSNMIIRMQAFAQVDGMVQTALRKQNKGEAYGVVAFLRPKGRYLAKDQVSGGQLPGIIPDPTPEDFTW